MLNVIFMSILDKTMLKLLKKHFQVSKSVVLALVSLS